MRLLVLLYVGPDALMPIASAIGAVAGLVMLFWGKVTGTVRRIVGFIRRE